MSATRALNSTEQKRAPRTRRATSQGAHGKAQPARSNGGAKKAKAKPSGDNKRKSDSKKSAQAIEEDEVLRAHVRKDPSLDRKIIEGMLEDRDALLAKMAELGVTEDAVMRRAAELGLSEALLRQVKGVAADLAGERPGRPGMPSSLGARTCLSCDRVFLSTGPGNRLCMRCRGGDAGLAQV